MSKTSDDKKKQKTDKPKRVMGQNAGPSGFLVEHGEKLAFATFGLIVLFCLYEALSQEKYAKTPEELSTVLQGRKSAVQNNTPTTYTEFDKYREVPQIGKQVIGEVGTVPDYAREPACSYPPPVYEPTEKRGALELLALEELRVTYVSEALALLGDGKKKPAAKPAQKPAQKPAAKKDDLLGPAGMMKGPGKAVGGGKQGKQLPKGAALPKIDAGEPAAAAVQAPEVLGGVHAPDADAKVFPGVLITGRVPRKKQFELYLAAFENARNYDPQRDIPKYVTFLILRSEDGGKTWQDKIVVNGPNGAETISFHESYSRLQKKFYTTAPEIVLPQHVMPLEMVEDKDAQGNTFLRPQGLTVTPLPPILGRDWPDLVAGGFPTIEVAPRGGGPGAMPGGAMPGGAMPGGALPGGMPAGAMPGGPGGMTPPGVGPGGPAGGPGQVGAVLPMGRGQRLGGMPPGVGPGTGGPGVGPGPIGMPPGGPGMNAGNPFAVGPQPDAAVPGNTAAQNADPHCDLLFRFFDFNVEEGKSYQYQVALVLINPNHKLPAGLIKSGVNVDAKYLVSGYTASEPVRISLAGSEVLAGPVRNRGRGIEFGAPEVVTAIIRQRQTSNGSMVAHTFKDLEAGQLLNLQASNIKCEKAVGGVELQPIRSFDFVTEQTIVDMKGSDRWPGETLVLDASGRLQVQREFPVRKPRAPTDGEARTAKSDPNTGDGLSFTREAKRLEWVYNYQPPTQPLDGAGGAGFGDILKPTR